MEGKANFVTAYKILENGNYDILLLENVNCENVDQLRARERYYIENLKCVNKRVEGRTLKEYREQNKDALKEEKKEYYQKNKEYIMTKTKNYYENNKEKANERRQTYYDKNKEKLEEKRKTIIECECGSSFQTIEKARHYRSKKHQQYQENK